MYVYIWRYTHVHTHTNTRTQREKPWLARPPRCPSIHSSPLPLSHPPSPFHSPTHSHTHTHTHAQLPLGSVSQCVLPGTATVKNEVELQFIETDAADRAEDALVEVRFYIPPGEEEESGAEIFQKNVLSRTHVQATTGDALITFAEDEGFFLYPRGRYVINLYANSFRIHGSKYDHKMVGTSIHTYTHTHTHPP